MFRLMWSIECMEELASEEDDEENGGAIAFAQVEESLGLGKGSGKVTRVLETARSLQRDLHNWLAGQPGRLDRTQFMRTVQPKLKRFRLSPEKGVKVKLWQRGAQ